MIEDDYIVIGQLIMNNTSDENYVPYPNIDYKYGPYNSLDEALSYLPTRLRAVGLTFAVKKNNKIVEYWFDGGINDSDAKLKFDIDSVRIIIK